MIRRIAWLVLVVTVFGGLGFAMLESLPGCATNAEVRQLVDEVEVSVRAKVNAEASANIAAIQSQIRTDIETGDIVAPVTFNGIDPITGGLIVAILWVMKAVPSSVYRLPVTGPAGLIRRRRASNGPTRPPNGGVGPRAPPGSGSP